MSKIKTVRDRERLKPRRDPYYEKLALGQYVGFRKMTVSSKGTWVARYREDGELKQQHKRLAVSMTGHAAYDEAVRLAREWFEHLGIGGESGEYTVKEVCELYLDNIENKGHVDDTQARFVRLVYSEPIAKKKLHKLKPHDIEQWVKKLRQTPVLTRGKGGVQTKDRLRSNATVNRELTILRAALNYAFKKRLVTSDIVWKEALKPIEGAGNRRNDYLSKAERLKLIACARPDLADFVRGLSLLPLRPGALAQLKRADLNTTTGELVVRMDKNGKPRKILLPQATLNFLYQQCENKAPHTTIFTRQDGMAWDKDYWKKPLKQAAIKAGLPDTVSAYTMRHSVITDLLTGGLDSLTVARLSDTSLPMIEKHYGHLLARHGQAALAALAL